MGSAREGLLSSVEYRQRLNICSAAERLRSPGSPPEVGVVTPLGRYGAGIDALRILDKGLHSLTVSGGLDAS